MSLKYDIYCLKTEFAQNLSSGNLLAMISCIVHASSHRTVGSNYTLVQFLGKNTRAVNSYIKLCSYITTKQLHA